MGTASPAPATKTRAKPLNRDDFDGDGHRDLVLTGDHEKSGVRSDEGLSLLLGSSSGVAAGRHFPLAGRFPGLEGARTLYSRQLTGDWDADGRADILVTSRKGAPDAQDGFPPPGAQIVWGGRSGVDGTGTRLPDSGAWRLAAGDFDGDGLLDLVSGPYRAVKDEHNEVRCVAIAFGPFDRDGRPEERRYADITRRGTVYAESLTVGDFDGDGRAGFFAQGFRHEGEFEPDVSYPTFHVDASYYRVGRDRSVARAGGLKVFEHGKDSYYDPESGGASNPPTDPPSALPQRRTGDFDGDGRTDVMIGVPGDQDGRRQIVYGGPAGPGTGRDRTRAPIAGDGGAVGDVNGDGRDDFVSATYTSRLDDKGYVAVFLGGEQGLAAVAAHTFDRTDMGKPSGHSGGGGGGEGGGEDRFGSELALADLDGDGCDEMAVRTEDSRSADGTEGAYWIIPGGPGGPVTARAQPLGALRTERG